MGLQIDDDGNIYDDGVDDGNSGNEIVYDNMPVSDKDYDFWKDIGINPDTTMENWKSPSNEEIEKAIQGDYNFAGLIKQYGKSALDLLKTNGKYDPKKLLALGGGLLAANKSNAGPAPTGYQGKIPKLTATSNMLTAPPVGRRPGSGGINYGGGVTYRDDKGNIVSSNEKTLEELRQAAASNPFNRGSTYESGSGLGSSDMAALLALLNQNQTGTGTTTPGTTTPGTTTTGTGTTGTGTSNSSAIKAIQDWYKANEGKGDQAALDKWLATSGYTAEQINAALPQWGVADLNKAIRTAKIKQWYNANEGKGDQAALDKWLATSGYTPEEISAALPQWGVEDLRKAQRTAEIKQWYNINNGRKDANAQADLNRWLSTSGYTAEEINAALPQWGVDDLNKAIGDAKKAPATGSGYKQPDPTIDTSGFVTGAGDTGARFDPFKPSLPEGTTMALDPSTRVGTTVTTDGVTRGYDPLRGTMFTNAEMQARADKELADRQRRRAEMAAGTYVEPEFSTSSQNTAPISEGVPGFVAPIYNAAVLPPKDQPYVNPYASSLANPATIPLMSGESQEQGAARLKAQSDALEARRAARSQMQEGIASGGAAVGMAKGGLARDGFVVPADVVSHFGNGSSEAGLKLLAQKIGATPIKGDGDGMSDSIKTKIDGVQEARVANDEAYVSPEMVKKLGNGSPEKGARKLYAMMDQIRKARTGTTKQGKQIDPNKYMPGGSVQRYNTGGTTKLPTGATGSESSLSNWAGDYVTNMLGQGAALANKPYEAYTGPLTAGASGLQNQAFGMAAGLQTPGSIGQAAGTAGGIANLAANMRYTPQTTDFLGGANMSGLGVAPSYGMGMPQQPPAEGTYGNPIPMPRPGMTPPPTGGITPPPAGIYTGRELIRADGPRSDYDPQEDNGMAHVQWEGPGNPRWEAEQRQMQNPGLLRTLPYEGDSGITRDPGYVPKDPNYGRGVDAEGREFFRLPDTSVDFGPDPLQKQRPTLAGGDSFQTRPMREYGGSRYDPATGIESRDLVKLQPGDPRLESTNFQAKPFQVESSEPFMQNGAMTGGTMRPPNQEAGLPGLMQGQQGMQAQQPQASQPVGNIAQQYMNPYLESALRPQMAEMQRAADIARMSDAARLTQAGAFGGSRQAIMESEGRRNLLGKQSDALAQGYSTAYDKAMAQFNADQARRAQEAQFGATFGLQGLQTGLQGAQTQAQAGALQSQSDINNLRATLEAGGVQRGIESEGIAADKAQFEEARLNPYKMLQFQQSLLSGMPLNSQSYNMPAQSNLQQFAGGAQTLTQLLKSLGYKFD